MTKTVICMDCGRYLKQIIAVVKHTHEAERIARIHKEVTGHTDVRLFPGIYH